MGMSIVLIRLRLLMFGLVLISCRPVHGAHILSSDPLPPSVFYTPSDQTTYVFRYCYLADQSLESAILQLKTTIEFSKANNVPALESHPEAKGGPAGYGAYASAAPFSTTGFGANLLMIPIKPDVSVVAIGKDSYAPVIKGDAAIITYNYGYGPGKWARTWTTAPTALAIRDLAAVDFAGVRLYTMPKAMADGPGGITPPDTGPVEVLSVASPVSMDHALAQAFSTNIDLYSFIGELSYSINTEKVSLLDGTPYDRLRVLARAYPSTLYEVRGVKLSEADGKRLPPPALSDYLSDASHPASEQVPDNVILEAKALQFLPSSVSSLDHQAFITGLTNAVNSAKPDLLANVSAHINNFNYIAHQATEHGLTSWDKAQVAPRPAVTTKDGRPEEATRDSRDNADSADTPADSTSKGGSEAVKPKR